MTRDDYLNGGAHIVARRGEAITHRKLLPEQVKEMRRLQEMKKQVIQALNEQCSISALARRYNVHERTIEKALRYETHSTI